MEKKYVKIQSNETIKVTSGLQFSDYTDVGQPTPNRKNVKPRWTKGSCLIKVGQHWYPGEVAKWDSVKVLEKKGILTIGQFADTCDDEEVIKQTKTLEKNIKQIKEQSTKEVKLKRLDQIAE